jgi:metallo-beta-lactamase class B
MTPRRLVLLAATVFGTVTALSGQDAGHVWTIQELFQRNVGTTAQQDTAFPPHKIIGNVYYVGTESLASFLVTTPAGHILINSDYERNVPTIRESVGKLGFKFEDIKILLGSHAHGDHMQGDGAVVELTKARAMAMAEDLPPLKAMTSPGGKPRPDYEPLHDGSEVSLGGSTLVAHHTPGHTPGCTTWTMKVQDGGKTYDFVIIGSVGVNPGTNLVSNPTLVAQYQKSFGILRSLHADVGVGSHPGMYNMAAKYARITPGGPNPYIDTPGYLAEVAIQEAAFTNELKRQQIEGPPAARGRGRE